MSKKPDGMEYVGEVWVDAGIIWIGDPCYTITKDASNSIDTWSEFCDKLLAQEKETGKTITQPLGNGLGLCTQTYYGDGAYPVYANIGEYGRPKSIFIDFDPGEDDE